MILDCDYRQKFVCSRCGDTKAKPGIRRNCPQGSRGCIHRGDQTGARECESCNGRVKIKTFSCDLHGECTLAKPLDGLACCGSCKDFAA
jgi:hypothetical protein